MLESPDVALGVVREVAAGTIIAREGDRVDSVYLVLSGLIALQIELRGQVVLIGLRGPGCLIGAVPAVLGAPHLDSGTALRDTELRSIRVAEFNRSRRAGDEYGRWLQEAQAWEVVERLRELRYWIQSDCEQRLDQLLVGLAALAGHERPDGSVRLAVPIDVTRLSELAVMRRETASRHLSRRIRAAHLLRQNGWWVVPSDSPLMRRIHVERVRVGSLKRRAESASCRGVASLTEQRSQRARLERDAVASG